MMFGKTQGKLLRTNHLFSIVVTLALLGLAIQYADDAYAATNDKLDVNLSVIYISSRSQRNSNTLGETVIQFPYPLSESARDTGEGPFGGITYFDNKTLVSNNTQFVSEMGLGRVYYSSSVPGDTPYTFVPFVTFFRGFTYNFQNLAGVNSEISGKSILLPGVLYAYRFNEKIAVHLDTEIYSYRERTNNRARVGFAYSPVWPWIISVSHERLSWDIDGRDVFVDGNSRENNIKIIFRDPPQGNFALTFGYGNAVRHAVGSSALPSTINSRGTYLGVEASGGVLAW